VQTYVVLENWTDLGIRDFRGSQERAEASASVMAKLGVRMKDVYWTMGPFDLVSVVEAPSDEAVSAALLADAAKGNVRTTTLRAFSREEMADVARLLD
jgi:uncharacterized protein with GYD domain